MSVVETILTILATGFLAWFIVIYNRLVKLRNQVDAAWSDIGVQLKRRHDLIPKLVDVVRQYAGYEQAVISRITLLRTESDRVTSPDDKGEVEEVIRDQLKQLVLIAEDYPDLKTSEQYLNLQRNLSEVENFIQHARRFYNGSVRLFNTCIETFPDMLVARALKARPREYFQRESE